MLWYGAFTSSSLYMTRTNRHQQIRRLTAAETKVMEETERVREEQYERQRIALAKRGSAFEAGPEVKAASTVMYALEDDMAKYIDRLTPAEWEARGEVDVSYHCGIIYKQPENRLKEEHARYGR